MTKLSYRWLMILFAGLIISQGFAQGEKSVFRVKYISAENIYLDAGSADGLAVGDQLKIEINGKIIAKMEIIYLAEHSASCKIVEQSGAVHVGENAVIFRKIKKSSPKEAPGKSSTRKRTFQQRKLQKLKKHSRTRVTGNISLQYYRWQDLESTRLNFSQPTLRFNIKARRLWNQDYNLRIKTRTRHNQRSRRLNTVAPEAEWRNRIYELSFSYENNLAFLNYRFGRIISNTFSGIGYIDGLLIQQNLTRSFHSGIFAGTQPEWQYSNFQTSIQKYGAYLNYQKGKYQDSRLESTFAFAGEYHGSTISREFIYFQNSYSRGTRWHVFQNAEVDLNRNWRKDRTNQNFSLTNLYISTRFTPNSWVSMGLTYDNRKNYQTYETRSIADSLFNDALRYGLRGMISLRLPGKVRLFGNAGLRKRKEDSNYTYSFSGGLNKLHFLGKSNSLMLNGSGFSNLFTRGVNYFGRMTFRFLKNYSIDLSGGGYFYRLKTSGFNRLNQWIRLGGRGNISYHFYLSGQYEYNWGDDLHGHRVFTEIGYRL